MENDRLTMWWISNRQLIFIRNCTSFTYIFHSSNDAVQKVSPFGNRNLPKNTYQQRFVLVRYFVENRQSSNLLKINVLWTQNLGLHRIKVGLRNRLWDLVTLSICSVVGKDYWATYIWIYINHFLNRVGSPVMDILVWLSCE